MTSALPGIVVITGSGGGLGAKIVQGLLELGITGLACHYRSSSAAPAAALTAAGLDPAKHLFRAELTDEAAVRAMRDEIVSRLGPVWGIVNVAGVTSNAMSWKLSVDEFTKVLNGNLLSTFLMTREFLPGMRERGGGRIINVSSVIAHTGATGASHYCAAKAGIEGFTRAVALEAAPKNVTANCLALGYFDQGIIQSIPAPILEGIVGRVPLKRLGAGSELAPLLAYLLSDASSFMTGQVIHFDGGLRT